jgi:hypothetical protein
MTRIVNLTPHLIRLAVGNSVTEIRSSGVARLTSKEIRVGSVDFMDGSGAVVTIPVIRTEYGEITNLPAPCEGVLYVTSSLVASRANRPDVVSPDTGPTALRKDGDVWAVSNVRCA